MVKQKPSREELGQFAELVGGEVLVATRSKYYKESGLDKTDPAILDALSEQPLMLRRPLLYADGQLLVGFDPEQYRELL
ncbi:MAG: hypothetical protein FH749_14800 [Firmicutes bacterium]|nr:hypothetical protein [Bacillota bacterium]